MGIKLSAQLTKTGTLIFLLSNASFIHANPNVTTNISLEPSVPSPAISGHTYTIDGAIEGHVSQNNLFFNFSNFVLGSGDTANFVYNHAGSLNNVFSEVTGNNPSVIDGTITSTIHADFWFFNPNGVIFGSGSAINVPAAFHVSNAPDIKFDNGQSWGTLSTDSIYSSMSANPVDFGFLNNANSVNLAGVTITAGASVNNAGNTSSVEIDSGDINVTGVNTLNVNGSVQIGVNQTSDPQYNSSQIAIGQNSNGSLAINTSGSGDVSVTASTITLGDGTNTGSLTRAGTGTGQFSVTTTSGDLVLNSNSQINDTDVSGGTDTINSSQNITFQNITLTGGSITLSNNSDVTISAKNSINLQNSALIDFENTGAAVVKANPNSDPTQSSPGISLDNSNIKFNNTGSASLIANDAGTTSAVLSLDNGAQVNFSKQTTSDATVAAGTINLGNNGTGQINRNGTSSGKFSLTSNSGDITLQNTSSGITDSDTIGGADKIVSNQNITLDGGSIALSNNSDAAISANNSISLQNSALIDFENHGTATVQANPSLDATQPSPAISLDNSSITFNNVGNASLTANDAGTTSAVLSLDNGAQVNFSKQTTSAATVTAGTIVLGNNGIGQINRTGTSSGLLNVTSTSGDIKIQNTNSGITDSDSNGGADQIVSYQNITLDGSSITLSNKSDATLSAKNSIRLQNSASIDFENHGTATVEANPTSDSSQLSPGVSLDNSSIKFNNVGNASLTANDAGTTSAVLSLDNGAQINFSKQTTSDAAVTAGTITLGNNGTGQINRSSTSFGKFSVTSNSGDITLQNTGSGINDPDTNGGVDKIVSNQDLTLIGGNISLANSSDATITANNTITLLNSAKIQLNNGGAAAVESNPNSSALSTPAINLDNSNINFNNTGSASLTANDAGINSALLSLDNGAQVNFSKQTASDTSVTAGSIGLGNIGTGQINRSGTSSGKFSITSNNGDITLQNTNSGITDSDSNGGVDTIKSNQNLTLTAGSISLSNNSDATISANNSVSLQNSALIDLENTGAASVTANPTSALTPSSPGISLDNSSIKFNNAGSASLTANDAGTTSAPLSLNIGAQVNFTKQTTSDATVTAGSIVLGNSGTGQINRSGASTGKLNITTKSGDLSITHDKSGIFDTDTIGGNDTISSSKNITIDNGTVQLLNAAKANNVTATANISLNKANLLSENNLTVKSKELAVNNQSFLLSGGSLDLSASQLSVSQTSSNANSVVGSAQFNGGSLEQANYNSLQTNAINHWIQVSTPAIISAIANPGSLASLALNNFTNLYNMGPALQQQQKIFLPVYNAIFEQISNQLTNPCGSGSSIQIKGANGVLPMYSQVSPFSSLNVLVSSSALENTFNQNNGNVLANYTLDEINCRKN